MIQEYALEPELVASWHDRMQFRFFVDQFGLGTGRVVSRYPSKWRKVVWESFQSAFGSTAGEVERKRIEELLARLTATKVRRTGCVWENGSSWLVNAEVEHTRRPFYSILARDNPRKKPDVMCADDVLDGTPTGWHAPSSVIVDRTAAAMATSIEKMLLCATRIMFVDPHFRASRATFRNPLTEFLRSIRVEIPKVGLELHTGHSGDAAPSWKYFRKECEDYLPKIVPTGLTLIVKRWNNRGGGERLHNRYILTDIGGVQFGVGLDEGPPGSTDDISLLSAESFRQRLEEYSGPAHAFELEGQINIEGSSERDRNDKLENE